MPKCTAILMFVRWPEPGRVKTRLAATVGPAEACRIHRLLAERCFGQAAAVPESSVIVCGTGASAQEFRRWLAGAEDYWDQPDGDLGTRLGTLMGKAFLAGFERVALIGSDAPELSTSAIVRAVEALQDHDVSLLPAADGGYVLLASSRFLPALFNGMPWSEPSLLERTLEACAALGIRAAVGEQHRDVDTEADWCRVRPLVEQHGSG